MKTCDLVEYRGQRELSVDSWNVVHALGAILSLFFIIGPPMVWDLWWACCGYVLIICFVWHWWQFRDLGFRVHTLIPHNYTDWAPGSRIMTSKDDREEDKSEHCMVRHCQKCRYIDTRAWSEEDWQRWELAGSPIDDEVRPNEQMARLQVTSIKKALVK